MQSRPAYSPWQKVEFHTWLNPEILEKYNTCCSNGILGIYVQANPRICPKGGRTGGVCPYIYTIYETVSSKGKIRYKD